FAGLAGGDGLDRVPVIGRGDNHSIDFFRIDQLAEVAERGGSAFQLLRSAIQGGLIDVADRSHLDVVELQECVENLGAAVGDADETEANFFIGPVDANGRRGGQGQGRGSGGECAAVHD